MLVLSSYNSNYYHPLTLYIVEKYRGRIEKLDQCWNSQLEMAEKKERDAQNGMFDWGVGRHTPLPVRQDGEERDRLVTHANQAINLYRHKLVPVQIPFWNRTTSERRTIMSNCFTQFRGHQNGARWARVPDHYDTSCGSEQATFLFRDPDDAVLFKLTWR